MVQVPATSKIGRSDPSDDDFTSQTRSIRSASFTIQSKTHNNSLLRRGCRATLSTISLLADISSTESLIIRSFTSSVQPVYSPFSLGKFPCLRDRFLERPTYIRRHPEPIVPSTDRH